ncbi:MAG TPA: peptidase, M56 family protein [Lachnospiraceae bacterium]|nr:peptidase, M56 family protein [Lachnospiraceae bacterium]
MGKGGEKPLNEAFKVVLSLSFSGSLVIIVLFILKPLLKKITSKRWQYYIWLAAVARLVLPFAPQTNLTGMVLQTIQAGQTALVNNSGSPAASAPVFYIDDTSVTDSDTTQKENGKSVSDVDFIAYPIPDAMTDIKTAVSSYIWLVWLGIALSLLVRKITVYQSFVNYVRAGWQEVSDTELLDKLAKTEKLAGVKRPVELYTNHLVSSPMLIGFFRPCIILPSANLPDIDFQYIIHHELVHYKRWDMFYKWLVQAVICIHWFNPFAWLMGYEINRACELACDEAVIYKLDMQNRRAYGDTLLHAIGTGGSYKNSITSVTLCQSAKLLKERLKEVMAFKQKSKAASALSVLLAAALLTGAVSAGAYTSSTAGQNTSLKQSGKLDKQRLKEYKAYGITKKGDTYYYNGQLVGILMDHQPGSSVYALNIAPEGLAIKITHNKNGKIKNVSYMTKKEIKKFVGEPFTGQYNTKLNNNNSKKVDIPVNISRIKTDEFIWLGTYQLEKGDKVLYDVSAKKGNCLAVGFAKPGQKHPNPTYHTICVEEKLEIKSGTMTWNVQSGKYSLFIHAKESTLTDVNGKVTIVKANAD